MRTIATTLLALTAGICVTSAKAQPAPPFRVEHASLSQSVTDTQMHQMTASSGMSFISLVVTYSGEPNTVDLMHVTLDTTPVAPLAGIDISCSAAPDETPSFTLVTNVATGPNTYWRTLSTTAEWPDKARFVFNADRNADLSVLSSPYTFCLLFVAAGDVNGTNLSGLGDGPLALPPLTASTAP